MPIKRGHVAPQNTYIVTLIRSFDPQCANFLAANALFPTKPILFCSDGLCDLLGYTKAQLMLKSSTLKVLYGSSTTSESIESLYNALNETKETAVSMCLFSKEGRSVRCNISVTPVRDENGQLPLYLLFINRDCSSSRPHESLKKRSSFKTRLQLKGFKTGKFSCDVRKTGHRFSGKLAITIGKNVLNQVPNCIEDLGKPLTPGSNTASGSKFPGSGGSSRESVTSVSAFQPSRSHPISDQLDMIPSVSVRPSNTVEPTEKGALPNTEYSEKPITVQGHAEYLSPVKRRPGTWCRVRPSSEEPTDPVLVRPASARGRAVNHSALADSEALRLVLTNHPEPAKSSVTEKFAQFLSMDEDLHVEHRFQSPHMHHFTLKHYSVFKAVWDWIILVLIIYTAIATPFVTVFLTNHGNKYAKLISFRNNSFEVNTNDTLRLEPSSSSSLLRTVEILVDVMFFVDIFINFRTTYVNKNDEVVSHPRRIATHYLKGWFFIDLVAAIPFDLIFFQSSGDQHTTLTSLLKSARLLRLVGIVRKLDRYSEYGASILLLLTALFALIAHWLACIWYAIGNAEHQFREPKIGWLDTLAIQTEQFYTDDPHSGPNLQTKYITALYFTFSSLTSIGFGNVSPNTNSEKVFSIVVMLVGSLMYASIFGNVGALIQRLYSGTARYHAQMLRIREFIRFHQIPSPLRQRLEEYSTQVWEHTNGIDMTVVQYSFPESLQSDICLYVYRDILGGSPAFKSLSDGCLRNISLRVRSVHMPPSDTLIHTGDLLTSLYYLVKGNLEVVTTDDLILGVLNPGDFFGGLPVLVARRSQVGSLGCSPSMYPCSVQLLPPASIPSVGAMSMAPPPKSRFAVRALTYADVHIIDRHDLADLCHVYPELASRILERFELTIPLASPNTTSHQPRPASPWFSSKSSLESFLITNSAWNAAPSVLLSDLVPLVHQRLAHKGSSRLDSTRLSEVFNCNRPPWELERLQRLFDHGALCPDAVDNLLPSDLCPNVSYPDRQSSNPIEATSSTSRPHVSHNPPNLTAIPNNPPRSLSGINVTSQSTREHKVRKLFAPSHTPAPEQPVASSLRTPLENNSPEHHLLSDQIDAGNSKAMGTLLERLNHVEKRIHLLDQRVSDTMGAILFQIQQHCGQSDLRRAQ